MYSALGAGHSDDCLATSIHDFAPLTPPSREYLVAPEDFLAARLDDTSTTLAEFVGDCVERACDAAANALSRRWPTVYSFDQRTSGAERARQLRALASVYRGRRGPVPRQPR